MKIKISILLIGFILTGCTEERLMETATDINTSVNAYEDGNATQFNDILKENFEKNRVYMREKSKVAAEVTVMQLNALKDEALKLTNESAKELQGQTTP